MTIRSSLDYVDFITKKLQHVKKYPMLINLVSLQLHHNNKENNTFESSHINFESKTLKKN
jgi:hypothetical protein